MGQIAQVALADQADHPMKETQYLNHVANAGQQFSSPHALA
jgi:hypothetical protein